MTEIYIKALSRLLLDSTDQIINKPIQMPMFSGMTNAPLENNDLFDAFLTSVPNHHGVYVGPITATGADGTTYFPE